MDRSIGAMRQSPPRHSLGIVSLCMVAAVAVLLLLGCPNPIPTDLAGQINDTTGPVITVDEPLDGSEYSTVVQVRGAVADGESGDADRIGECRYSIANASVSGDFSVDESGAFVFTFATLNSDGARLIDGLVTLQLSASDWSGNVSTSTLELVPGSTGDVPGFSVTPGNGEITVEWGDVPGAVSYDLFEYKYGQVREDVTSGYVWGGLANGSVYRFQVRANIPEDTGQDAYSSNISKMPLSPRTFAPWVREVGYQSITIEWWQNPNVTEYTVERSVSPEGPWEVRRSLAGSAFVDTEVDHDIRYYYRVSPTEYPDIPSDHKDAVPGRCGLEIVANCSTDESAVGLSILDTYAYVAAQYAGLRILDISDPLHPELLDHPDSYGFVETVAACGGRVYLTDNDRLDVLDVSDPANPIPLGSIDDFAHRRGLAVAEIEVGPSVGTYVVGVDWTSGLIIVDVTDPSQPGTRSELSVASYNWDLAVAQILVTDTLRTYALIAAGTEGLAIVDITDPANPGVPAFSLTGANASGVAIAGSHAYVADLDGGLTVLDISDPAAPVTTGSVEIATGAGGVDVDGDHAFVSCRSQYALAVVDIRDPASPALINYVQTAANEVAARNSYAFVAGGALGVNVVDLSALPEPSVLCQVAVPLEATAVALVDTYAYVGCTDVGGDLASVVVALDVSNPAQPQTLGSLDLDRWPFDIVSAGSFLYVTGINPCGIDTYISVVDISDPVNPTLVKEVPLVGNPWDIAVAGSAAYVASDLFETLDISIPGNPRVLTPLLDVGMPTGVTVAGGYAFISGFNEFGVLDVSDPFGPVPVSASSSGGEGVRVAIVDSYAILSNDNTIGIVDISNPLAPGAPILGPAVNSAFGLAVSGPYVFLGDGDAGLTIIGVSDPENPGTPMSLVTGGEAWGVAVSGSYAYLADGPAGLTIIKLVDAE